MLCFQLGYNIPVSQSAWRWHARLRQKHQAFGMLQLNVESFFASLGEQECRCIEKESTEKRRVVGALFSADR